VCEWEGKALFRISVSVRHRITFANNEPSTKGPSSGVDVRHCNLCSAMFQWHDARACSCPAVQLHFVVCGWLWWLARIDAHVIALHGLTPTRSENFRGPHELRIAYLYMRAVMQHCSSLGIGVAACKRGRSSRTWTDSQSDSLGTSYIHRVWASVSAWQTARCCAQVTSANIQLSRQVCDCFHG
jgi:hypothetical protein